MHELTHLPDVLILLSASIFIIVFLRNLKLSPVLGYLIAGAFLDGYDLVKEPKYAHYLAEFGVVFLLFVIGLELTFERLMKMRLHVFGFGGLQLALTSALISTVFVKLFGVQTHIAIFMAAALTLSSTAIVLQVLNESRRQSTQVGRLSLSVLLMQDFAVVPLLAVLPILAAKHDNLTSAIAWSGLKAFITIILITIAGRLFLRPLFSIIGSAKSDEVYVPTTLLIVLGAAMLTNELGLSTAMGAFLAGILIAETEYRNKVENSIMPFKSLFLGLFFMTVGMQIEVDYIFHNLSKVLLASAALLGVKAIVIAAICLVFRFSIGATIHAALLLAQGGEFAFIVFNLASDQGIIEPQTGQLLLMVVAVTMAVTPLLSIIGAKIEDLVDSKQELDSNQEFKGVTDLDSHVIIAGFGRVGRIVAYMLSQVSINYVAVDSNAALVKKARKQGFPIFHGDLSDLDTLKSVGAERASSIILTMSEKISLRKATKAISQNYRSLNIVVRVEDFRHGFGLRKLGATVTVPSTIEAGLQLGGAALRNLGVAEHETLSLKDKIRQNDYSLTEEIELFRGIAQAKAAARLGQSKP
jgi:CPA2 family monovalent cation:H+ antiporter-2